mmetsp:Transcript_34484/g.90220  ORF Transcript_34484/g.90220 Transcript_34484/m.90220 type:complete len:250 (-) Transcript_34484:63-812(-)
MLRLMKQGRHLRRRLAPRRPRDEAAAAPLDYARLAATLSARPPARPAQDRHRQLGDRGGADRGARADGRRAADGRARLRDRGLRELGARRPRQASLARAQPAAAAGLPRVPARAPPAPDGRPRAVLLTVLRRARDQVHAAHPAAEVRGRGGGGWRRRAALGRRGCAWGVAAAWRFGMRRLGPCGPRPAPRLAATTHASPDAARTAVSRGVAGGRSGCSCCRRGATRRAAAPGVGNRVCRGCLRILYCEL